jgi:hypothetical protein
VGRGTRAIPLSLPRACIPFPDRFVPSSSHPPPPRAVVGLTTYLSSVPKAKALSPFASELIEPLAPFAPLLHLHLRPPTFLERPCQTCQRETASELLVWTGGAWQSARVCSPRGRVAWNDNAYPAEPNICSLIGLIRQRSTAGYMHYASITNPPRAAHSDSARLFHFCVFASGPPFVGVFFFHFSQLFFASCGVCGVCLRKQAFYSLFGCAWVKWRSLSLVKLVSLSAPSKNQNRQMILSRALKCCGRPINGQRCPRSTPPFHMFDKGEVSAASIPRRYGGL